VRAASPVATVASGMISRNEAEAARLRQIVHCDRAAAEPQRGRSMNAAGARATLG
jgi:hypothetical protein